MFQSEHGKLARLPSASPKRADVARMRAQAEGGALLRNPVPTADLNRYPLWQDQSGLPRATDVKQGKVGDCWLLATLASLASTSPEYLKSLIQPLPNGRYLVHLGGRPVDVGPLAYTEYDEEGNPKRLYASFHKATWVALIEKAMVKVAGYDAEKGYDAVEGGLENEMMAHLGLGRRPVQYLVSKDPELAVTYAWKAVHEKRVVVAAMDDHAYSIIGKNDSGFELYNPHGYSERIGFEAFKQIARRVTIAQHAAPAPLVHTEADAAAAVAAASAVAGRRNAMVLTEALFPKPNVIQECDD